MSFDAEFGRTDPEQVRSMKYRWLAPGFFRVNVCGWRFVAIDTRRHWALFSDRHFGWRCGPYLFRISTAMAGPSRRKAQ